MAQTLEVRVFMIHQMKFNQNNTISLYDTNNKFLLHLPRPALDTMIQLYESILVDLSEKDKTVKKYWSEAGTDVYSCSKYEEVHTDHDSYMAYVRNLCMKQSLDEVIFSKEAFETMILTANILLRHQKEEAKVIRINSTKTMEFNVAECKFSLFDEQRRVKFVLPIAALAVLIAEKKAILDDLHDVEGTLSQVPYWFARNCIIQSVPGRPRLLLFNNQLIRKADVYMNEDGFKKMLQIALTGTTETPEMEEFRRQYFGGIPINTVKSVKFSDDNQEFTLIDEMNCVALTLPIAALDTMSANNAQILSDLQNEIFQPSSGKDFISEYWSNGRYNLRTSVFLNSYRDINYNVVRFSEVSTNTFKFVIQERAFRELLNVYRNYVH